MKVLRYSPTNVRSPFVSLLAHSPSPPYAFFFYQKRPRFSPEPFQPLASLPLRRLYLCQTGTPNGFLGAVLTSVHEQNFIAGRADLDIVVLYGLLRYLVFLAMPHALKKRNNRHPDTRQEGHGRSEFLNNRPTNHQEMQQGSTAANSRFAQNHNTGSVCDVGP